MLRQATGVLGDGARPNLARQRARLRPAEGSATSARHAVGGDYGPQRRASNFDRARRGLRRPIPVRFERRVGQGGARQVRKEAISIAAGACRPIRAIGARSDPSGSTARNEEGGERCRPVRRLRRRRRFLRDRTARIKRYISNLLRMDAASIRDEIIASANTLWTRHFPICRVRNADGSEIFPTRDPLLKADWPSA